MREAMEAAGWMASYDSWDIQGWIFSQPGEDGWDNSSIHRAACLAIIAEEEVRDG